MAEIEVAQADITKLEVDAIANAANTELRHGGGVAGAISRAGPRSLKVRCCRTVPDRAADEAEESTAEFKRERFGKELYGPLVGAIDFDTV